MTYNALINIYNEFDTISDDLLDSTYNSFKSNLCIFKEFCDSNDVILEILEPVINSKFDGLEYFSNSSDWGKRNEAFPHPNSRVEFVKVPYDLIWKHDLIPDNFTGYVICNNLSPYSKLTNDIVQAGVKDVIGKLINYIGNGLNKLITDSEKSTTNQVNINIQNAHDSIIGTQTNATINNNGLTFEEISKIIEAKEIDSADKQELLKLNEYMKTLTENNTPMTKGTLAKFSSVISKHSWALSLIGNALIKHFIG